MPALASPPPRTLKRSMRLWMANDRAWDDSAFALQRQHTPPPKPRVPVGTCVE